jgi:hypothetical protein
MDEPCFDRWTRQLAARPTRRAALRYLAGATLAGVVGRPWRAAPPARAFKLGPHEAITRQGLAGELSTSAISKVVGSFAAGTGNLGTDQHQGDPPSTSTVPPPRRQYVISGTTASTDT